MEKSTSTQFPQPTDPLPPLTKNERDKAMRLLRLVKAGRLHAARFRLHEKHEALAAEWANNGGAQVCT